jgi:hypothetical protein
MFLFFILFSCVPTIKLTDNNHSFNNNNNDNTILLVVRIIPLTWKHDVLGFFDNRVLAHESRGRHGGRIDERVHNG